MEQSVIAKTEKLDEVVRKFSSELDTYIQSMEVELASLERSLTSLGEGWVMSDYGVFRQSMEDKMKKIRKEIASSKELKAYLDVTADKFSKLLARLKKAATGNQ